MNRLTAYVNGGQNKSGHCIKTIDLLNQFNGVLHFKKKMSEDTKGVTRTRNQKKDRQCNA